MGSPLPGEILANRDMLDDPDALYERPSERLKPAFWRMAMVLVVAASVVGAAGVLNYHPLTAHLAAPAGASNTTMTHATPGTYGIAYSPRGEFEYSFVVMNAGRWGITVTGMDPPAHPAFDDVTVEILPPGATTPQEGPFALRPGASAEFRVHVTFAPCKIPPPTDSRSTWTSESISYRFAGISGDQAVALPFGITIDDASAKSC